MSGTGNMGAMYSASDEETLHRQVLRIGSQALEWLGKFGREQITLEELEQAITHLGAEALLAQNWSRLLQEPALAPCLEVLQLLSSLETELHYQVLRYGPTSLFEDYKELELALARLRRSMLPAESGPIQVVSQLKGTRSSPSNITQGG